MKNRYAVEIKSFLHDNAKTEVIHTPECSCIMEPYGESALWRCQECGRRGFPIDHETFDEHDMNEDDLDEYWERKMKEKFTVTSI